ncbi:LytR/AlgR family response regulator transcription factor [Pedobacter sp. UC225_61]|uniref:LytR/AlgR family response regulator transcription factor n=1 Tax=Pedobacter sp. UC225_61 TaxID=3374623 RepID=UPI0037A3DADC
MRILIIEDEVLIASRIQRMVKEIWASKVQSIVILEGIEEARSYLEKNEIDLLLLDLNLNGQNGFSMLEHFTAQAFHTIIISAHTEKAVEAFEYGVVDFVPKPFDRDRLSLALDRADGRPAHGITVLAVRQKGVLRLVKSAEVRYFKGSDIYAEIHLKNGETLLYDKTLERLSYLLGDCFERIHKSFLVATSELDTLILKGGASPMARLKNGELLPVGRTHYRELKKKIL